MKAPITIALQPMGVVEDSLISFLQYELAFLFGAVRVCPQVLIPETVRVPERGQLAGGLVLSALAGPEGADAVLGVVDEDLFAANLNFVFGLAHGQKAIISLARLRQEFYGLPPDHDLFRDGAKKEAVHELGHVFGLPHCDDGECVMHFSNSIVDTDFKGSRYCRRCQKMLEGFGVEVS